MKKQNYSVMTTSILVKAVFVLIIVCCIFAPLIVRVYDNGIIALTGRSVYMPMIITLYLAAAVAQAPVVYPLFKGKNSGNRRSICLRNPSSPYTR